MSGDELKTALISSLMKQIELLEKLNLRLTDESEEPEEEVSEGLKDEIKKFSSSNYAPSPS